MSEKADLKSRKAEIEREHGAWTAHNVDLGDGLFTIESGLTYDTVKLRRVVQAVSDLTGGGFSKLRVLDLGVLEGLYTLELSLQGAREAVGIEARDANLVKSEFSREALALSNARFIKDDVRNLSEEKHGRFDLVLCLGLLYHLDEPAVFEVLERMAKVCDRYLVIDSLISLEPMERVEFRGQACYGRRELEFKPGTSVAEKAKSLWSSADNDQSFLLTKKTLFRMLERLGFTSVFECHVPLEYVKPPDRVTMIAVRGRKVELKTFPALASMGEADVESRMRALGGTFLDGSGPLRRTARKGLRALRGLAGRAATGFLTED